MKRTNFTVSPAYASLHKMGVTVSSYPAIYVVQVWQKESLAFSKKVIKE